MRFEKKQKNTEFEQKMILEKLHKAGNENEALEMLTNAILGGHTNVVQLTMVKTLKEQAMMNINGNMKKAVLKEGNEKNKNEKDIKNQKLKMILMMIFHLKGVIYMKNKKIRTEESLEKFRTDLAEYNLF